MELPRTTIRFGPFELCPKSQEIWKHGVRIKLRRQPMAVLQILLDHSSEVVTREELQRRLWPSDTFVDFEHGLNTAVKELRGALGDSAMEPRYIETLPRVGYRMLVAGDVVSKGAEGPTRPVVERVETPEPVTAPRSASSRRMHVLAATGVVLLLAALAYVAWKWKIANTSAAVVSGRTLLAVMPFENLTGDSGQEYFSEGLTEEMIAQLGWLDPQRLGIVAGPSAARLKATGGDVGEIGKRLRVQYVLSGSVRRDGEKVRVTAKLIQMRDQMHVWSREYDREMSNLLALQSEIAREIAGEIRVTLDGNGKRPRNAPLTSKEVEAYDVYLRGRYFWNKRTEDAFRRGAKYFQLAVEKDPSYARAYAGLADCYTLLTSYGVEPAKNTMATAKAASQKALQLDEGLAEAHTSAALVAEIYDWDWKRAEAEFRRAIELNPSYATAHHWYAEYLAWQGRFDEAFREIELARQSDPLSLSILTDRGVFHYFAHQNDEAIAELRAVLEMDSRFPRALVAASAMAQEGRFAEALKLAEEYPNAAHDGWIDVFRAYLNGRAGNRKACEEALARLRRTRGVTPYQLAAAEMGPGNNQQAIALLERAFAERSISMDVHVDPVFDPLRKDPRFEKVIAGMGLGK